MTTIDAPTHPSDPGQPDHTDASDAPTIPASLAAARGALSAAASEYLAIPDATLERSWFWRERELDVRYGVYRGAETIEAATAEIDAALAGASLDAASLGGATPSAGAPGRGMAARIISMATIARWALHGRLASLDDAILDQPPREGEWTVRQVLGHTIDGQRSYGWVTRWRISLPPGTGPIKMPPDVEAAADAALPGEEADAIGTLAELRARLDACLDEWALGLGSTPDEVLSKPALWSNTPVDVAFRFGRWSSHIAEHTVQLDKTLGWLGYQPSEVARVVRDLHFAWGRLESRLFPAATTSPEIDAILARVSDVLVREARSTRAAAEA